MKKVAIITGDGPEHHYVANRICQRIPVSKILVVSPAPRRRPLGMALKNPARFADKVTWRLFLKLVGDDRARAKALRAVLGPDCEGFQEPGKVVRVGGAKDARLIEELRRLEPDIIAVYGTSIIPDSALRMAKDRALNMHTGLSPWYRGTACSFWPIHNGEPDKIGATVHACTQEVDGGEIFFVGSAEPRRHDDLHAIFARSVQVGTEGYVRVLEDALVKPIRGSAQDLGIGREYRGNMRGLRSELRARMQLRRMRAGWRDPDPA